MNYKNFYENSLYPLQDEILSILNLSSKFYLTGGTALSRFYFDHRYSEDLDFFSIEEIKEFKKVIEGVLKSLPNTISWEGQTFSESFARIILMKNRVSLKVDFVNEVSFRWGEIKKFDRFNYVDNEVNILANKISSLERYEVKDIVDIWVVARNRSFFWKEVVAIAEKKAVVSPIQISKIIKTMPEQELTMIKWAKDINLDQLYQDLQIIAKDILLGQRNTLRVE